MASFEIIWKSSAQKDLYKIPSHHVEKLLKVNENLLMNHFQKALKN